MGGIAGINFLRTRRLMKKGGIEPDLPIYLFIVIIFYDHV